MTPAQAKRVAEMRKRMEEPNCLSHAVEYVRDVTFLLDWLEQAGEIVDEDTVITIKLPLDLYIASPNVLNGQHWAKIKKIRDDVHLLAQAAWVQAGRPRAAGPIVYDVTSRRPRRLDDDNAVAACKFIADALFKGRIIPNDSVKWAKLGKVNQVGGKIWEGREEVQFQIRPR